MKQFRSLLHACEIHEISKRIMNISDIAGAFSDPAKAIRQLQNDLNNKKNSIKNVSGGNIFWEAESNVDSKIQVFKNSFMR